MPKATRDRDALLIFLVGAAYAEVFLVGKPEKEAKALATDVATSIDGTPLERAEVQYSSEEGYAVVVANYSHGVFGAVKAEQNIPVGDIAERLRAHHWNVS